MHGSTKLWSDSVYSVAKQILWNFQVDGERRFFIMFGGLHIEIALQNAIGGWLEESGWAAALTEANLALAGTADSFLKSTGFTRT